MKRIILVIYLPKTICNWLFGESHPFIHRLFTGLAIAIAGVFLARFSEHLHNETLSFTGDLCGYGLHGIGITPIIERMTKQAL